MNVVKTEGPSPIPETITEMGSKIISLTGMVTGMTLNQEY
jgi:hypothetical protein